jgi:hypothetical protein
MLAGIRDSASISIVSTRINTLTTSVHEPVYTRLTHLRHTRNARTRSQAASFPLKICEATIGSSSCSIILLFFLYGSSRCAYSRP